MFCNNCGKELEEGLQFCADCGTPVAQEETPVEATPAAEQTPVEETPVEETPVAQEDPELAEAVAAVATFKEDTSELSVDEILAQEAAAAATAQEYVDVAPMVEEYAQTKMPKKKKKGKGVLIAIIVVVLVAALGVGAWFGYNWWTDSQTYDQAIALLAEKNYDEALKLFKELGDFEDSAQKVAELTKQQADYDAAKKLLEEEKFEEAQKGFAALKDYRDSMQYTKYAEAKGAFASAEKEEDFAAAAALFEALGEFQDSKALVSKSYLEAAFAAVEAGEAGNAEQYLEKMTEEDQKLFEEAYHDEEVLEGWEKALQARYDMEIAVVGETAEETEDAEQNQTMEGTGGVQADEEVEATEETEAAEEETTEEAEEAEEVGYDFVAELELLEPLTELACKDKNLEELLNDYYEAVEAQQENLDDDGFVIDWVAFYEQELVRSQILDEMNEEYDFLEENEELNEWYVGMTEYFEACYAIESSLTTWGQAVEIQEEDGKSYVDYTNDTEFDFTVSVCFVYYDADGEVISEEYQMGALKTGEKLRFYLEVPKDMDSWNLGFAFEEYQELEMEKGTE